MNDQSFKVTAGDSQDFRIEVRKPDPVIPGVDIPYPLDAFDTFVWLAKRTPNAPDSEAVMTVDAVPESPASAGIALVHLDSEDWEGLLDGPSKLYWRLRITSGDDVETLAMGELEVVLT